MSKNYQPIKMKGNSNQGSSQGSVGMGMGMQMTGGGYQVQQMKMSPPIANTVEDVIRNAQLMKKYEK